jgi:hypothetical protein
MNRAVFMIAAALALSGCAVQPPTPEDVQAKRFDTVADKAVIYIVRDPLGPGLSDSLSLDDNLTITTHPATYYRWEVTPGTHRIQGFAASNAQITVRAEAGQLYFIEHVVSGTVRMGVTLTHLQRIDPAFGRTLVRRAEPL